MKDPIVEEVRRAREAHAKQFNYDLDDIRAIPFTALNLDEVALWPEDIQITLDRQSGRFDIAGGYGRGDFALDAGGGADKTLAQLG